MEAQLIRQAVAFRAIDIKDQCSNELSHGRVRSIEVNGKIPGEVGNVTTPPDGMSGFLRKNW